MRKGRGFGWVAKYFRFIGGRPEDPGGTGEEGIGVVSPLE
jgi:hypothetical protein